MEAQQNPLGCSTDRGSTSFDNGLWSSETTWAIASGALSESITFDSSDDSSPVESDSPRTSTPLILKPASPDSGPCEIKLYFSQKYAVRQIYIRSTARVYEIYYSQSQHNGNEYLCTARCCIAERDGQVLQAVIVKELSDRCSKDTAGELSEEKLNGEENPASSEDDWVDVKVLHSLLHDNRAQPLSIKTNPYKSGHIQDYYEATVEISDSEPCCSVTIRLLSLQSKDCVSIDEIYVFAELVDPIHSQNPVPLGAGSAGSSLMSMVFPAILQLSKSGMTPILPEQASDNLGEVNKVESLLKSSDLSHFAHDFPQDEKSDADRRDMKVQDLDGSTTESTNHTQLQNHKQTGVESNCPVVSGYSQLGRIEEVLGQLMARVSKIEEVCLRFEENMFKPINSMETRIQRVEEQLESLAKSGLHSGTRISAPSFSCNSTSSSFHTDVRDSQPFSGPDLDGRLFISGALSYPSEGMSDSDNAPCFVPSLVATALEFSCNEDEKDNYVSGSLKEETENADVAKPLRDSPQVKPKKRLIDDVLAAALSNFLLSPPDHPPECQQASVSDCDTSQIIGNEVSSHNFETLSGIAYEDTACLSAYEESPKYTQILAFTAPEFILEESGFEEYSNFGLLSSAEASRLTTKTDETSHVPLPVANNVSVPVASGSSYCAENKSACDQISVSKDVASTVLSPAKTDTCSSETAVKNQFSEESPACSFWGRGGSFTDDRAKDSVRTDRFLTTEEAGQSDSSILSTTQKKDDSQQIFGYNIDVSSSTITASIAEGPGEDILRNVSEYPTASLVDCSSLPAVDIRFHSRENCSTQSSLEVLLGDLSPPEVKIGASSTPSGGDFGFQETSFIDMEGDETIDPLTSNRLLVDLGIYDMVVSSDEEGGLENHYPSSNHEMVASLI